MMKERYGLIGHPLGHSISNKIHQSLYRYYGMDGSYLHFDLLPQQLPDQMKLFRSQFQGFNITIPYKKQVLPFLDEIRGDGKLFEAVNTVAVKEGRLIGYNTDGLGFMKMLAKHGITVAQKRVVVLGAGGAGGVLAQKIGAEGAAEVTVLNRSVDRARAVAEKIAQQGNCTAKADAIDRVEHYLAACDVLVNATSIGMYPYPDAMPLNGECDLKHVEAVVDIIYNPGKTRLLQAAEKAGCKTVNGLGMLLYQAFYAFEIWTGKMPPDALEDELERELAF